MVRVIRIDFNDRTRPVSGSDAASGYPRWVRVCEWAAIAAAVPTVLWRGVVGLGVELGTPVDWRRVQQLPGSGTSYVLGLSALQLVAALLTLVLILPYADRIPPGRRAGRSRRLPMALVVGCSGTGTAGTSSPGRCGLATGAPSGPTVSKPTGPWPTASTTTPLVAAGT